MINLQKLTVIAATTLAIGFPLSTRVMSAFDQANCINDPDTNVTVCRKLDLNAHADGGTFIITMPDGSSANFTVDCTTDTVTTSEPKTQSWADRYCELGYIGDMVNS
jgi:hypothetical protein